MLLASMFRSVASEVYWNTLKYAGLTLVFGLEQSYDDSMSKHPLLVAGDTIAGASTDALIATAHALVREAADKARAGTVGLSRDELIDQIIACQQVQNSAWAAQSVRLAQVAAIEEIVESGKRPREVRRPIGKYADEWLPAELGTRLGWSDRQATNRLTDAIDAMKQTPTLFALTEKGSLDPRKLSAVSDALCGAGPKVAEDVEGGLLAVIDDARGSDQTQEGVDEPIPLTATKLVRRARRLLADLAPAEAERSAAKSRAAAKGVRVWPHHEPGLSAFHAVLATEDAVRIMSGVNELARQLHQDTTTDKCLDECRVDAFADLILGHISVSTTCVLQLPILPEPADAAADRTEAPSFVAPRVFHDQSAVAGLAATIRMTGRLSCESGHEPPAWLSASFVEPTLEEWLRSSVDESLDILTTMDTPNARFVVHTPCHGDASAQFGPGVRLAPRVEVDLTPGSRDCRQRWDPGSVRTGTDRHRAETAAATESPDTGYRIGDAVIEGIGVIPAGVLTRLCQTLGVKLSRALVDAKTGATVETSDATYRPGARLRRFVVTRDQHCRFPSCTRPARLDDVDHVTPWPDGPTAAWNLQCLCRHHHRAKHEGGWRVSMTSDGICTWTSPSGRRYVTRPAD